MNNNTDNISIGHLSKKYPTLSNHGSRPVAEKAYKGFLAIRVESDSFGRYRFHNHTTKVTHWVTFVEGVKIAAGTLALLASKKTVADRWIAAGRPGGHGGLIDAYVAAGLIGNGR